MLELGKTGTVAFSNGTRQLTGRHPLLNATPGYGFAVAGILAPADIASSPSQIRMFAWDAKVPFDQAGMPAYNITMQANFGAKSVSCGLFN